MPYGSKTAKRRGAGYRRKPYNKRAPTNMQLNKKIKKLQQDEELKMHEVTKNQLLDLSAPTPGSYLLLNGIAVGTNFRTRIGNQVRATSLSIRYSIDWSASFPLITPPLIRILIFWDRQANQTYPEVFGLSNGAGVLDTGFAGEIYAQTNINNWKRYKLLYDKVHNIIPYSRDLTTEMPNFYIKKKIKLNRIVQYDDTNATQDAISTNSLWMCAFSTAGAADLAINKPTLRFASRFYFKDD
jgi:hypothetical protein